MLKKTLLSILFAFLILISSSKIVSAKTNYLVNNNGVKVSQTNYEKLKLFGFDDKEIKNLSQTDFNKYVSRKILFSYNYVKYIETTYTYENETLLEQNDRVISKDEALSKVKEFNTNNLNLNSQFVNTGSVDNQSVIVIDPGDGGGGSTSDITKTKYENTTYKQFSLYGVYYADKGNYGEFYIKTTLNWLITPAKRYNDIISLAYTDNVMLAPILFDGQEYPNIFSNFTYTHQHSDRVSGYTRDETVSITPSDYNLYQYNVNDHYIGVEYDLPSDQDICGQGVCYSHDAYSNFRFELVNEFTTTTAINGATFAGWYTHQTGSGHIDWGNISITYSPPYFSYSTSFWVDDPTFDAGIGGTIIFSDLA